MNLEAVTTIIFSPTGNSRKTSYKLAKSLELDMTEMNLTLPNSEPEITSFEDEDIVIFSAPVYSGRLYTECVERFKQVSGSGNTPCVCVVTYGSRAYDDALLELCNLAKELNFKPIAAAAIPARHTYGDIARERPNEEDLEQLEEFAEKILDKTDDDDFSEPTVPGSFPYSMEPKTKFPGFIPVAATDGRCVNCGKCAKICPVGAIEKDQFFPTDPEKCISCFSCIRNCFTLSRSVDSPEYSECVEKLNPRVDENKELELFL